MVLTLPLMVPLVEGYGLDLIWFGVVEEIDFVGGGLPAVHRITVDRRLAGDCHGSKKQTNDRDYPDRMSGPQKCCHPCHDSFLGREGVDEHHQDSSLSGQRQFCE